MRYALCFSAIGLAAATFLLSSADAAVTYPYCIKSPEGGGCWYENYEQCRASAVGTGRECFIDASLVAARRVLGRSRPWNEPVSPQVE